MKWSLCRHSVVYSVKGKIKVVNCIMWIAHTITLSSRYRQKWGISHSCIQVRQRNTTVCYNVKFLLLSWVGSSATKVLNINTSDMKEDRTTLNFSTFTSQDLVSLNCLQWIEYWSIYFQTETQTQIKTTLMWVKAALILIFFNHFNFFLEIVNCSLHLA